VAFDDKGKVAYLIGNTNVYVIDMSPTVLTVTQSAAAGASELPLLGSRDFTRDVTDVQFCGDYVAISTYGDEKTDPGRVYVFARYNRATATADEPLQLLTTFIVGESAGPNVSHEDVLHAALEQLYRLHHIKHQESTINYSPTA
jgi:hypothetical protein